MSKQQQVAFGAVAAAFIAVVGVGVYHRASVQTSGDLLGATAGMSSSADDEIVDLVNPYDPTMIVATVTTSDGQVTTYTQAQLDQAMASSQGDILLTGTAPSPSSASCMNVTTTKKVSGNGVTPTIKKDKFMNPNPPPPIIALTHDYRCKKEDAENEAEAEALKAAKQACEAVRNGLDRCATGCSSNLLPMVFTQTNADTKSKQVNANPVMQCAQNIAYNATSTVTGTCEVVRECKLKGPGA